MTTLQTIPSNVNLLYSPYAESPYTVGILHPKIVLTELELTDQDKNFIVMHELRHVKNKDNFKLLIIELLICVYWWFPFIYLYRKEVKENIEMDVDFQLVKNQSKVFYKNYSECLISVENKLHYCGSKRFITNFVLLENDILKKRINFLVAEYKIRQLPRALVAVLIIVPFLATSVIFEATYDYTPETEGTFIVDPKNKDDYVLKANNKYYLIIDGKLMGVLKNAEYIKDEELQRLPIKSPHEVPTKIMSQINSSK